ncbi:KRAB-A domain-containing protein 2-like isoform X1 [Hydractinia symbiolongicarpus]|uniref:KRAB-A domain-containing protein 2-like isoform X1 n=2 Tax=Hydractinia symbiolongicarpus TaxID=13093 RepID=UPI00254F040A|nr:KRAB-A domain-containing protein 2-like isoform X1 [Hydractinia symbiolongicarpus]
MFSTMETEKRYMEEKFQEWLEVERTKRNSVIMPEQTYKTMVDFLCGRIDNVPRAMKRKLRRKKFQVMSYPTLGISDVLCSPFPDGDSPLGKYRRVATDRQMFHIINRVHRQEVGHQGVHKTFEKIARTYDNVTRDAVGAYIKLCTTCCLKSSQIKKAPLKPIITTGFLQRVQIDLIAMLSKPDADYNYIGHVVDHFSKFRILFPMKGKSANEFASNFFRSFLATFGLPKILHSDNGAEFINHVMDAVAVIWPGEVSFVHGKPRHSQSQGLVEQGNNTIQVMISAREKESQTSTWSEWLPEIQFIMNASMVRSVKKTPYEIVFGQKPNGLGQISSSVRSVEEDIVQDIIEEMEENGAQDFENAETVDFLKHPSTRKLSDCSEDEFETTCPKRQKLRQNVVEEGVRNAEMMRRKYSNGKRIKVADFLEGDNVSLTIPKGLRTSSDLKRLPCVIVHKSGGNQPTYKLLCSEGTIQRRYTASALQLYPQPVRCKYPSVDEISLSEAVRKINKFPTVFCRCRKGQCKNKQCKCFLASLDCTSRCHQGDYSTCVNRGMHNDNISEENQILHSDGSKLRQLLPNFGGSIKYENETITFHNTCALDTWMAVLKAVIVTRPSITDEVTDKNIQQLFTFVKTVLMKLLNFILLFIEE